MNGRMNEPMKNPKQHPASDLHIPTLPGDLRIVLGNLIRRLREQTNEGDLTSSQKAVILHLDQHGSATVTRLAAALGVRSQSMGATVAALEATGRLVAAADPDDGRRKLLTLSTAFQATLRAGRAAREDWLSSAIQGKLSAAEQEQLAASLPLLQRLISHEQ